MTRKQGKPKRAPPDKRRSPRQERAVGTLQCILEATAKVLVARGYAKTTTNHVAEQAGISVGSLYQYFRNKESVVLALIEAHCRLSETMLAGEIEKLSRAPVRDIISHVVHAIVEFNAANHDLCSVFYSELPRDGEFGILNRHFENCARIIEPFLIAHRKEVRVRDTRLASYFLVHTVVGVYFGTPRELRSGEHLEHFRAELEDLVLAYLLGDR